MRRRLRGGRLRIDRSFNHHPEGRAQHKIGVVERPGFHNRRRFEALLAVLPWADFPERPTDRPWPGPDPDLRAPFVAAYLIKFNEGKPYMSDLRAYLLEHPALVYWLGFRRVPDPLAPQGFNLAASVPKRRHLSTVLRTLSNDALQFLLTASVELLRDTLSPEQQGHLRRHRSPWTPRHCWPGSPRTTPSSTSRRVAWTRTASPQADPDCALGVKKGRTDKAKADPDDIIVRPVSPSAISPRRGKAAAAQQPARARPVDAACVHRIRAV